jgi:hypothetical protein
VSDCDAGNPRGKHVFVFDGEKNSERCRCGRYEAIRSSHLEFDRQVVPAETCKAPVARYFTVECGTKPDANGLCPFHGSKGMSPDKNRPCHITLDGPSAAHSAMADEGDLEEHIRLRHQPEVFDLNALKQEDARGTVFTQAAIDGTKGQTVPLVDRTGPVPKVIGAATVQQDVKVTIAPLQRLIHWSGTPAGVCERKDKGLDAYYPVTQPNIGGTVSFSALADHPGNVTCPTCKAEVNKGCNRHRDCKEAEKAYKEKHGVEFTPANFHCRNDDCEDCFGS